MSKIVVPILEVLEWNGGELAEALHDALWEAIVEEFGVDEAEEVFNTYNITIEIDGDHFVVSAHL